MHKEPHGTNFTASCMSGILPHDLFVLLLQLASIFPQPHEHCWHQSAQTTSIHALIMAISGWFSLLVSTTPFDTSCGEVVSIHFVSILIRPAASPQDQWTGLVLLRHCHRISSQSGNLRSLSVFNGVPNWNKPPCCKHTKSYGNPWFFQEMISTANLPMVVFFHIYLSLPNSANGGFPLPNKMDHGYPYFVDTGGFFRYNSEGSNRVIQ